METGEKRKIRKREKGKKSGKYKIGQRRIEEQAERGK